MTRKFTAALAAFALVFAALAPGNAAARDRHDGYYGGHQGGYYGGGHGRRDYRHYGRRDHDGDAVAAGVIGLVLGLALGAAASGPRAPRYSCYDNYQRCAGPPPPCGANCYQGYYNQGYAAPYGAQPYANQPYDNRGYDPRYDGNQGLEGGYYNPNDPQRSPCTRRERQWDRYANRYVMVDVPC